MIKESISFTKIIPYFKYINFLKISYFTIFFYMSVYFIIWIILPLCLYINVVISLDFQNIAIFQELFFNNLLAPYVIFIYTLHIFFFSFHFTLLLNIWLIFYRCCIYYNVIYMKCLMHVATWMLWSYMCKITYTHIKY